MKSTVIYTSHSGNTEEVARAMAHALEVHGSVTLIGLDSGVVSEIPPDTELLLMGGPTEQHGATREVLAFFEGLGDDRRVEGMAAAAFDTRLRWPHWLSGSAAEVIDERLRKAGARMVVEPESFIVSMKPELEPGEEQRARAWAATVAHHVETAATLTRS